MHIVVDLVLTLDMNLENLTHALTGKNILSTHAESA